MGYRYPPDAYRLFGGATGIVSAMLSNVRIVLVRTSHPGNIGAAARAMKNMCLTDLRLVAPAVFPHADATARASGADDVLASARVHATLDEALSGARLVVGLSARLRSLEWPRLELREAARRVCAEAAGGPVAVVFGAERTGLHNEELEHCQYLVGIDGNPDYLSLNLAAAVQVVAHEVYQCHLAGADAAVDATQTLPAPVDAMERFYQHLEQVLVEIDFMDPDYPRRLLPRLRRLFNRARPDDVELNILRGILTAMHKARANGE